MFLVCHTFNFFAIMKLSFLKINFYFFMSWRFESISCVCRSIFLFWSSKKTFWALTLAKKTRVMRSWSERFSTGLRSHQRLSDKKTVKTGWNSFDGQLLSPKSFFLLVFIFATLLIRSLVTVMVLCPGLWYWRLSSYINGPNLCPGTSPGPVPWSWSLVPMLVLVLVTISGSVTQSQKLCLYVAKRGVWENFTICGITFQMFKDSDNPRPSLRNRFHKAKQSFPAEECH